MVYLKFGITGIQDFIFNVTSKGAAKSLRSRSFFVEACTNWAQERILKVFPKAEEIYNGGGNFILTLHESDFAEEVFFKSLEDIKNELLQYNLIPVYSYHVSGDGQDFGAILKELNFKTAKSKYSPNRDISFYLPKKDEIKMRLEMITDFNQDLINAKSFSINHSDSKQLLDRFTFYPNNEGKHKIVQNIPKWDDWLLKQNIDIINELRQNDTEIEIPKYGESVSFQFLAEFAKRRTGTSKIGVLKLDVDNFGLILGNIKKLNDYKNLSKKVTEFFEIEVINLMNQKYSYDEITKKGERGKKNDILQKSENINENIYTVFLGGDDCFIIGSWDVLLDFIDKLKERFDLFSLELLNELDFLQTKLTFSASYIIIDSHFPVIKFADIAEEELFKAKNQYSDRKNTFSLFNEVLPFEDFKEVLELKNKFQSMILEEGTEKGIIQKFVNLFTKSDNMYWQKFGKPFNPAIIWRFIFILRDIMHKSDYKNLFLNQNGIHEKYVKNSFKNKDMKHRYIQIGARITEFLTKSK
jgi:CRISPR-associated protein Csm1